MRKNLVIGLGIFLLVAASAFSQTQDPAKEPPKAPAKEVNISGVWDMVTQTPNGDRPGEVTFNMAIIGPALRKDAPAFMAAVRALPNEEVSLGPATVRAGGRDIPVPPGSYELRTEYLVEGEKVDVITVDDVIVTVRKNP